MLRPSERVSVKRQLGLRYRQVRLIREYCLGLARRECTLRFNEGQTNTSGKFSRGRPRCLEGSIQFITAGQVGRHEACRDASVTKKKQQQPVTLYRVEAIRQHQRL